MEFGGWEDRSCLEAASWRLASELSRRHPRTTRLIRGHPGGGQSDCLWLIPAGDGVGDVRLNRDGTIQVLERFDGQDSKWPATEWDAYLRADPRRFLLALEAGAGLAAPVHVPPSTPRTLTLRVLATLAATAVKSVHPLEIVPGFIDTSGGGGGVNEEAFVMFPAIPADLLRPQAEDLLGRAEYRFWFVRSDDDYVLAFEQSGCVAWTPGSNEALTLRDLYVGSGHRLLDVVSALLPALGPA